MTSSTYPPIAVVGVSALFPGSINATGFWKNILDGEDLLTEIPESHWLIEDYYDPDPTTPDKFYARRGGFLPEVDFSPMEFGVPPNIIPATDTAQLLALGVAKSVLEDAAGGDFSNMDRDKISVIMGVASATELVGHMSGRLQKPIWERALRSAGLPPEQVKALSERILESYVPWQESTFPGLLGNVVAGRIANRLDLGGTNCVVDAACASSLAALEIGINELYLGQSDMVITGGVDTLNDVLMFMCFGKTTALSMSGDCRPFSDQADGTMLGEGIGMIALKRLEDAERDGDSIYAVLKGLGTSSDGRAKSIYAPVSKGQAKALRRAYDYAGYGPRTVELVEAHGTGTKAGDAAEFGSLNIVFGDEEPSDDKQWCALGSVKSQIGHAKAAAGAGGLFKVIMALHHKTLPPTIKIDRPNPALEIEQSAFYLNTQARPWIRGNDHPRRASVSSFGFGGTNFHVALEEYTGPANSAHRSRVLPGELFTYSADTARDLLAGLKAVEDGLEDTREHFIWAAYDAQSHFKTSLGHRVAFEATGVDDLRKKLASAHKLITSNPNEGVSSPQGIEYGVGRVAQGKTAFLYPGQGSQYVDMGSSLAIHFDAIRDTWDTITSHDEPGDDVALHRAVFPPPAFTDEDRAAQQDFLTETHRAQPAIGAVSQGMTRLLRLIGVKPDVVAGHSYGEVSALWAAGVLSDADFLKVSRKRGQLMAEASTRPGTMTAVSYDLDQLKPLLNAWNIDVVVANHNSPQQVVMSGSVEHISSLEQKLGAEGISFTRLNVATAFHSPIVSDSVKPFVSFLSGVDFSASNVPVFANSEAAHYPDDASEMRRVLSQQIANPVRFVEQTRAMVEEGVRVFIEVGPGNVLTKLAQRILADRDDCTFVSLDHRKQDSTRAFLKGLSVLAAQGIPFDMKNFWDGYARPENPALTKKPVFTVSLNGANHGKPHPRALEELPALESIKQLTHPKPSARPSASSSPSRVPVQEKPAPTPPTPPQPTSQDMKKTPAASTSTRAPAPSGPSSSTIEALERLQQQATNAHQTYQRLMAQNHEAFLNMAQASLAQLTGQPKSETFVPQTSASFTPAPVAPQQTAPAAPKAAAPQRVQAQPERVAPAKSVAPKPAPVAQPQRVQTPSTPAPKPSGPSLPDLRPLMLDVVSQKTGYPTEMLEMSMELEADLGIDSIKRVEILSSMQERVPSLPEVDTNTMASLVTLQEIVDYMQSLGGTGAPAPTPAPAAQAPAQRTPPAVTQPAPAAQAPAPAQDLMPIMLDVVSEKTGYPTEMLEMSMELEADLGIDSIKRVEILSSVQEQVPSMPEVDTNTMAALVTLQEIVDYMQGLLGGAPQQATPAAAPTQAAVSTPQHSAPAVDLLPLMMDVVSQKTGYPTEMLEMSMELEADLGIDSIKRVEILSSMQERVPSLPEVDTNTMAALVTLEEIVNYMQSLLTGAPEPSPAQHTPPAVTQPAPAAQAPAPAQDLMPIMLDVVSEKTGYPTEMLEMSMELEADLGIDSIKRVEILSSVQEQVPSMPEVDTNTMASLVTLQEIVDYMQGLLGKPEALVASPQAQNTAPPAVPTQDLMPIMLDVVSEKTGYPTEMLEMSMELEADLGIDSIKRVEILSSVQEQVPSMPEVDTNTMASLVTLQEIVDYMQGLLSGHPAPAVGSPTPQSAPTVEHTSPTRRIPTSTTSTTSTHDVARYAVELVAAPELGFVLDGLAAALKLEVIDDGQGVGTALTSLLNESGWSTSLVTQTSGTADGVIFLGGLRPAAGVDDEWNIQRDAFAIAREYAAKFEEGHGLFVTVQDTGGAFGLDGTIVNPWRAGLPGLVKTLNQEWPNVSAKAIDIDASNRSAEDTAITIYQELVSGGPELEIAIDATDARRTVVGSVASDVPGASVSYSQDDVIVVSGGAKGVTASSIIELARQTQASFVLLGRSELSDEPGVYRGVDSEAGLKRVALEQAKASGEKVTPRLINKMVRQVESGREIRQTLQAIDSAGARAQYIAVDVRNQRALSEALSAVRAQWGPITGLVHGAGVLADALLSKKTIDQFERVFLTKVDGLKSLLGATEQDPLRMICMFSSVAARSGNTGQSDYAMANETLNKVALSLRKARGGDVAVKSLGWGPWDAGMVGPALKAMFEERGIKLIGLDDGAKAFALEVQRSSEQVELVLGGGVSAHGLYAPIPDQGVASRVFVHAENQPFLQSHRIQGKVVLPVVLVMEWFTRLAQSLRPDQKVLACENVRVLRGIPLERFDEQGHWLVVLAKVAPEHDNALNLMLLDEEGKPRFAGRVVFGDASDSDTQWSSPHASETSPWASVAEMYQADGLFHGPDFQVIQSIEGISEHGVLATFEAEKSQSWAAGPWLTTPALIDGALQIALLYGLKQTGSQSLPLGIARYEMHQRVATGPIQCELVRVEATNQKTRTDIRLTDSSHQLVAMIRGVEMFVVPNGTASS